MAAIKIVPKANAARVRARHNNSAGKKAVARHPPVNVKAVSPAYAA